jgi:uncharacterized membrane protein
MAVYKYGVKSTASIAGHPIHPILVAFPIAFLIGLLASTIVYDVVKLPFWAYISKWLAMAGVVTMGFAAIFGIIDFVTISRARALTDGWVHFLGNVAALIIAIINTTLIWSNPILYAAPLGLVLSAITAGILLVTGWYGGELAYRYGIGVLIPEVAAPKDQEIPPYQKRAA